MASSGDAVSHLAVRKPGEASHGQTRSPCSLDIIMINHSFNKQQIDCYKAGSILIRSLENTIERYIVILLQALSEVDHPSSLLLYHQQCYLHDTSNRRPDTLTLWSQHLHLKELNLKDAITGI